MVYGTHNSFTSYKLIWWCYLIPFIRLTSRCQSKTLEEQLDSNVRVFNIQIAKYKGEWMVSHGLAWFDAYFIILLKHLSDYAVKNKTYIYIRLSYDNHFFMKKDIEGFKEIAEITKNAPMIKILECSIEHFNSHEQLNEYVTAEIDKEEHYWTLTWAKSMCKFKYYMPYPKYWAKKYNNSYIENCKSKYLMLDYV